MLDFKYEHHKLMPYIGAEKVRNKQFFIKGFLCKVIKQTRVGRVGFWARNNVVRVIVFVQ